MYTNPWRYKSCRQGFCFDEQKNNSEGGVIMRLCGSLSLSSLKILPWQIDLDKINWAEVFQNYNNKKLVAIYISTCIQEGVWFEVPSEDLLKKFHEIAELNSLADEARENLFKDCLDFLSRTGIFDLSEQGLLITEVGVNYLYKNYHK